jgi:hypothetical protein
MRIPAIVVCIATSFVLCALTSCDSLMALKVDPKAGSAAVAADDELYVKRLIADVASEHGLVQIENPRSDAIVTYRRNNTGVFFKNGAMIALFRARNKWGLEISVSGVTASHSWLANPIFSELKYRLRQHFGERAKDVTLEIINPI